jgi:FtsZ-binding cell division protein ZapB
MEIITLKENNRKLASQMEGIMKRGEDLEKENESLNTELSKEAMKAIRLEVDKKEKMVQFWANKVF